MADTPKVVVAKHEPPKPVVPAGPAAPPKPAAPAAHVVPEVPPKKVEPAKEPHEYPRWVKVHQSWIVKSEKTFQEMHDSGHWNHIVNMQVLAKRHITAGPRWPEFYVHATGIVDVKVKNAEQEAKATSHKNPTEQK